MYFPKILHLEGGHKLTLLLLKKGEVIGENHEVINVECNDTESAIFGIGEHSMI